jgi:RNA polymerase sigma factor for flagellar operon FliA
MTTSAKEAKRNHARGSELSAAERDEQVMENLPQVKYIARRIHNRLPEHIPIEDLVNAGIVGLLEAIDRYEPGRDVKLATYAKMRIEGAILDTLREFDWSPRELRKQGRAVERALQKLSGSFSRAPSENEIAEEMGIEVSALQKLLLDLRGLDLGSLEAIAGQSERGDQLCNYVPTSLEEDPLYICFQSELRTYLTQALSELPERERQMLSLYYVEELTMKEIGAVLGVGEGRISQIHSAALLRLRVKLQDLMSSPGSVGFGPSMSEGAGSRKGL